tara:strand:- start:248 stop:487 length:240 start_codon:yes stop_codon:yes gene_type:complete
MDKEKIEKYAIELVDSFAKTADWDNTEYGSEKAINHWRQARKNALICVRHMINICWMYDESESYDWKFYNGVKDVIERE